MSIDAPIHMHMCVITMGTCLCTCRTRFIDERKALVKLIDVTHANKYMRSHASRYSVSGLVHE